MLSKIYKYFLKLFPFHSSVKDNTLISVAIIFLFFDVIFQPFDFDKPATLALIYNGISFSFLFLNLVDSSNIQEQTT